MTSVDACVVIWFLSGRACPEVDHFKALLAKDQIVLAPSIVAELLSDPKGGGAIENFVDGLEMMSLEDGYWSRAGLLRARVRRAGRKAALGDALAAQASLDAGLPLLTGDGDFRAFAELAGLTLAIHRRSNHPLD